jgi:phosphohistidine phosphatase SixA
VERIAAQRLTVLIAGALAAWLFGAGRPATQEASHPPATPRQILALSELIPKLRGGGYVIHLRHAATEPERPDLRIEDPSDCGTQRQLSEGGREQSRRMGEAFRALGVPVGAVRSSPYCRCLDTARLAFGRVEADPGLVSSLPAGETEAKRLAAALRARLGSSPAQGTNDVLVGHMSNLKEATGIWPEPEGVAHVFEPLAGGGTRLVAEIRPDEWTALAQGR